MIIKKAELETVCGITSKLPAHTRPEFAFAGKSNVGKSSLINAMMNRKSLARTSSQPGKTQTINFYNINDALYFVDLPGYGYAKVSLEAKAKWGKMIENYLKKSQVLHAVFLLVDIRHDPSENDKMMYDWVIHNGYRPVVIATKLDKLKRSQVAAHVKAVRQGLGMEKEDILIPFSAETKHGRDEIWELIEGMYKAAGIWPAAHLFLRATGQGGLFPGRISVENYTFTETLSTETSSTGTFGRVTGTGSGLLSAGEAAGSGDASPESMDTDSARFRILIRASVFTMRMISAARKAGSTKVSHRRRFNRSFRRFISFMVIASHFLS